ncbi:MAG: hypothetical protein HY720_25005 [Planctomycetes bacterium]|nr:hypothetical protein [Planctomycetota bacterium]
MNPLIPLKAVILLTIGLTSKNRAVRAIGIALGSLGLVFSALCLAAM